MLLLFPLSEALDLSGKVGRATAEAHATKRYNNKC